MALFNTPKQSGFSYIEIVFSFALLALFGTSLFMTQSAVFSKVIKAHQKITAYLTLQTYNEKIDQSIFELNSKKDSLTNFTLKEHPKNSSFDIEINIQPVAQQSELFKLFGKDVHILHKKVLFNRNTEQEITFLYNPESSSQKDKS